LSLDPNAAVAANNLAMLTAYEGGNLDVALRLAQTATAKRPSEPKFFDTLGWIYYRKGLPSLAIPPLEKSLAKDPTNRDCLAHLGLAYAKSGEPDKARSYLQRALAQGDTFTDAKEARAVLNTLGKG
jgi:Flp pilus assembly protein TadD